MMSAVVRVMVAMGVMVTMRVVMMEIVVAMVDVRVRVVRRIRSVVLYRGSRRHNHWIRLHCIGRDRSQSQIVARRAETRPTKASLSVCRTITVVYISVDANQRA